MDRFVNQQNINRYRRLASETTSAADRQMIMKLLAEEEAKFKLDMATCVLRQIQRSRKSKMLVKAQHSQKRLPPG